MGISQLHIEIDGREFPNIDEIDGKARQYFQDRNRDLKAYTPSGGQHFHVRVDTHEHTICIGFSSDGKDPDYSPNGEDPNYSPFFPLTEMIDEQTLQRSISALRQHEYTLEQQTQNAACRNECGTADTERMTRNEALAESFRARLMRHNIIGSVDNVDLTLMRAITAVIRSYYSNTFPGTPEQAFSIPFSTNGGQDNALECGG